MKRLYFALAMGIAFSASAQQTPTKLSATQRQSVKFNPYTNTTIDDAPSKQSKAPYAVFSSKSMVQVEEYVGTSIYDLQTNNSIQNRIIADDAGVAACFTFSATNSSDTYPDRGTGYNYRTTGVWQDDITQRVESMRVGWTSLMHPANGSEVLMNHSGSAGIKVWTRPAIGTGNWVNSIVPTPSGFAMFWPRAVSGGADGNSIHMVCLADPNAGAYTNGMTGPLLYNRSIDGGATWDLTEILLPGLEDTTLVSGFSADTYAIHARGNKIAIACYGDLQDSYIWISNDNGESWTRSTIWDFPIDHYVVDTGTDIELDGIQDTILSSDGAGALFIDASGTAHAAFGTMFFTDEPGVIDSSYTLFPLTGSIIYWNETMIGSPIDTLEIGFSPDVDATIPAAITEVGRYGNSGIASHPQLAEAADGTIFCSYQAVNENYFNGAEYLRHIYAVKSNDGGATWTAPADITPDIAEDGYEYVYASMAPFAYGDKIHLIVQRDNEPGIHVQPETAADPVTDNDQIYVCVSLDLVGVEESSLTKTSFSVFPNPTTSELNIQVAANENGVIRIFNANGQLVRSFNNFNNGTTKVDVSDLANGVYEVQYQNANVTSNQRFVKQ